MSRTCIFRHLMKEGTGMELVYMVLDCTHASFPNGWNVKSGKALYYFEMVIGRIWITGTESVTFKITCTLFKESGLSL